MVKAYSDDLRQRCVDAMASGEAASKIATRFGVAKSVSKSVSKSVAKSVAKSSVIKWHQRYKATGSVSPLQMGPKQGSCLEPHRDFIHAQIQHTSHLTVRRLAAVLKDKGIDVSHNAVWLFLRREGLSFKKTLFAIEQGRADGARRRQRWKGLMRSLDPQKLVFIDETWIKTNMAQCVAGANGASVSKPMRHKAYAPHGKWRTMTFVGALRHDQITAPCVFDGPINGDCFKAYVAQVLRPILKQGDIVIMDNLGSHKAKIIRQMIKKAGARLWFLPPYSPDLNPIEQAFSQIKHWMRMAQKRTADEAWKYLGKLIDIITPKQCRNYIKNAGYGSINQ